MNKKLPFSLTTRKTSPYYYVRFRNEKSGKFMGWVSTKETNYNRALRKAWELYNDAASSRKLEKLSFYDTIRKSDYTKDDVQKFLEDFQRKGFLTSFILNDSTSKNLPALPWFLEFWDPEKSEYIREKARKGQTIHKKHAQCCSFFIIKHWTQFLDGLRLGEISRKHIQMQFDRLDAMALNGNTKNHILRSVLTPLKWAYNNELIPKDISKGWIMYKPVYKKRTILTRQIAESLFKTEWENDTAKLASMLAMCTGMRIGEITALVPEDIGDYYIDVRHSWNRIDGLKCTKNGEERRIFVPFPNLIAKLRNLAAMNPHVSGAGYVFWGKTPDSPVDRKIFVKYFHRALEKTGFTEEEAKKYTFHSWRHFYTTYMADRINARILQTQTGHKTRLMLEHYSSHEADEDSKMIMEAQTGIFGAIVEE